MAANGEEPKDAKDLFGAGSLWIDYPDYVSALRVVRDLYQAEQEEDFEEEFEEDFQENYEPDHDNILQIMKKKGWGDLSSGWFMEFEESDEFFGVSSDEEYVDKLHKFIDTFGKNRDVEPKKYFYYEIH
jgi:hypothetical protein